ncbi:MAG TPA: tetratricopeptide repeat protein [Thermoanaerobaculia bacterium]|nr:tetratricopeptide repeat protein [Thermoanaerobaculia bacterium]
MNEIHYDDETLIELFTAGDSALPEVQSHVDGCRQCGAFRSSFETFASTLSDPEVWQTGTESIRFALPDETRIHEIRELAASFDSQEFDAEVEISAIVRRPSSEWSLLLGRSFSLHSPGGIRKLIEAAHQLVNHDPADAMILASTASAHCSMIEGTRYPRTVIADLRGRALKEEATVLRYLGRYEEGLDLLERSEGFFNQGSAALSDLTSLDYQRACLLFYAERIPEAIPIIRRAALAFGQLGDSKRYQQTRSLEAAATLKTGDTRGAIRLWLSLLDVVVLENDLDTLATILTNLGQAYLQLQAFDDAGKYFHQALQLQKELGLQPYLLRSRWGLARILVTKGQWDAGLARLREIAEEFEQVGMMSTAGLVKLEIAELLLAMGKSREVSSICGGLVEEFSASGMATSAITAVAYLQEAASAGNITVAMFKSVREQIEDLPSLSAMSLPR